MAPTRLIYIPEYNISEYYRILEQILYKSYTKCQHITLDDII